MCLLTVDAQHSSSEINGNILFNIAEGRKQSACEEHLDST
jgi:hypothetical protein